jgi:hypothetical protein
MAELKTKPTGVSVDAFIAAIADEKRRGDCSALVALIREATGLEPRMWGAAMVGFGSYHYRYASGREGDWFVVGFAPRKSELTIYLMAGRDDLQPLLAKLGRYKARGSCLYVRRLADVDLAVLRELITRAAAAMTPLAGHDHSPETSA